MRFSLTLLALLTASLSPAIARGNALEVPPSGSSAGLVGHTAAPPPWVFEELSSRRDALAVAISPDGRRAAYGNGSGVWWIEPAVMGGWTERSVFREGAVRDLHVAPDGGLWIATETGLFEVGPDDQVHDRSPAPGAGRDIRDIDAAPGGCFLVSTGRGAFERSAAGTWQAVNGEAPRDEVTATACGRRGGNWLVSAGDLYEVHSNTVKMKMKETRVKRRLLPGVRGPIADVSGPAAGPGPLLVLTPRRLFWPTETGAWEWADLPLPPGVEARRIVRSDQEIWIATDRGLYWATQPEGPWRSGPTSLAAVEFSALAAAGSTVLAAGGRGVMRRINSMDPAAGRRAGSGMPSAEAPVRVRAMPTDPGRDALMRAVLRYLQLDRGPMRSLSARARARGWLPSVELRGGYGGARRRQLDYDQTFSSGEDRLFRDRDRSRSRDFDVAGVLRWDFGDTVYHEEELDLAKERREVIELRDEVLDEVNRLYFERQRVLLDWAAHEAPDPEADSLALRADELGAGLDAWTGGWWSERVPPLFSSRFDLESTP